MTDVITTLAFTAALGTGLVGGLFFGFSTFIMRGLGRLPAAQGIAAMQSINITVIHPTVMVPFFGTGALCVALAWLGRAEADNTAYFAAAALYVLGCIAVTGTRNVPLNDRLAAADATSAEAATLWQHYLTRWTFWNHVRTAACVAAAAALVWALLTR